jgi:hypothetical protein
MLCIVTLNYTDSHIDIMYLRSSLDTAFTMLCMVVGCVLLNVCIVAFLLSSIVALIVSLLYIW